MQRFWDFIAKANLDERHDPSSPRISGMALVFIVALFSLLGFVAALAEKKTLIDYVLKAISALGTIILGLYGASQIKSGLTNLRQPPLIDQTPLPPLPPSAPPLAVEPPPPPILSSEKKEDSKAKEVLLRFRSAMLSLNEQGLAQGSEDRPSFLLRHDPQSYKKSDKPFVAAVVFSVSKDKKEQ